MFLNEVDHQTVNETFDRNFLKFLIDGSNFSLTFIHKSYLKVSFISNLHFSESEYIPAESTDF